MKDYGSILTAHIGANVFPAFLLDEDGKILAKNEAAQNLFYTNTIQCFPRDPAKLLHTVTLEETPHGFYFCMFEKVSEALSRTPLYCMFFTPAAATPMPNVFSRLLDVADMNTEALFEAVGALCEIAPDKQKALYAQAVVKRFVHTQRMILGYMRIFNEDEPLMTGSYPIGSILDMLIHELPPSLHELPYVFDCDFSTDDNGTYRLADLSYMALNMISFLLSVSDDNTIHGRVESGEDHITVLFSTSVSGNTYRSYRDSLLSGKSCEEGKAPDFALYFANRIALRGGGRILCDHTEDDTVTSRLILPRLNGKDVLLSAGNAPEVVLMLKRAIRDVFSAYL